MAAAERLELRALLSAGSLDLTFSSDGKVTGGAAFPSSNDYGYAVTVTQPDGKVLVGGQSSGAYGSGYSVTRFNADGTLDASFGRSGVALVPLLNGQVRSLHALADGKVLVESNSRLARLNADGSIDMTFGGGNGYADVTGIYGLYRTGSINPAAVVQSDGKIVLAGYIYYRNYDFALVRLNADGSRDLDFDGTGGADGDGDGVVTVDFGLVSGGGVGTYEYAMGLALGPGDSLVAYGRGNGGYEWAAARLSRDGAVQWARTFATPWSASDPVSAAVDADGRVVLAGYGAGDFLVVRFNADGSRDLDFDGDGDPGADGDGVRRIDFGGGYAEARSVAIDASGKIVVGGYAHMGATGNDFALARLNADGSLDTGFDGDGKVTTNILGVDDAAFAVTVSGSAIFAAGYARDTAGSYPYEFAVAKYETNAPPSAVAGIDQSGDEGASITFNGAGSLDVDGDLLTYSWDFGDGSAEVTGSVISHIYANDGVYTVTLTVSDGNGGTATDTLIVSVENVAPTPSIELVSKPG